MQSQVFVANAIGAIPVRNAMVAPMTVPTFLALSRGLLCAIALAVCGVCWHGAVPRDAHEGQSPLAQRSGAGRVNSAGLNSRAALPVAAASTPARRVALAAPGL